MDLSKKIISLPIQTQYFPFFPTFMKYILQNSSPKLLLKLYQCCKYFYFKLRITIAPNVWYKIYPKEKVISYGFYDEDEKSWNYQDYPNDEKFWLCDKLRIHPVIGSSFNCGLIGILNKIYRNNLKELTIDSKFTIFKELEILSKSPNLINVELNTVVKNENDEPIPIEEIMVLFPNLKEFEMFLPHFTKKSFQKLSEFQFLNKFKVLKFWSVNDEFDPISLCNFLEKIFEDNAEFTFMFRSRKIKNQLLPRVKEIINEWKTKKLESFVF
uniref:F-box domain-containing protein n=1 Tax=Panagrolaimus davidi TaxID=227884 RepID=A0A914PAE8_9BILA